LAPGTVLPGAFFMGTNYKHYLILNLTVFVWGFTGVLGDQISINSEKIVFFRMGLAFLSLLLITPFYKTKSLTLKEIVRLMGTGIVVGLHWVTFFYAIKVSNVSVAVVCMSSSTLFTAFIEPLFFKRKVSRNEIILSIAIVIGILFIFGFEPGYAYGITIGLFSAMLASFFGVFNAIHIKKYTSLTITKFEMLGGFVLTFGILTFSQQINADLFKMSNLDIVYLLILALVCTTAAFMISVWIMKFLTPFTVSMSINMEPIYAILIALVVNYFQGKSSEIMSGGFYVGTLIIIGSIFMNAFIKKRIRMKKINTF
jgi:drug/metabolite transporter (DMT)-like permease